MFIKPPFNMLVSGMTGCGKTHYILDLLETEFKNKFDYIIIICPSFDYNKTYNRKWIDNDECIFPLVIDKNLNKTLEKLIEIYKDDKEQTLIIIDDCANLHDAKLKATALTKLAFHGRHYNISTWVLTQKYNAIIKDFRQNIKHLVLFYDKDEVSREASFKENNIGITNEKKKDILKKLESGSKLVMRLSIPFEWKVE